MARIRKIEIHRFRGIKHLIWDPSHGVNCLIGPGDSSKSTILEAIELGLGSKRNYQFSDAEFYLLNVDAPIIIDITIGELEDSFKKLDTHGLYLRGYNTTNNTVDDEPAYGLETVLTIRLTVNSDLEPLWTLHSDRSDPSNPRFLTWSERQLIAPSRIGSHVSNDLTWKRGSILNKISDEKAHTSSSFAQASRLARSAFGEKANEQLINARSIVTKTAQDLGVGVGDGVQALLDLESISISGGSIALHNDAGIPLKNLGTGSARLLTAGLQNKTSNNIIIVDELEHGLEPHRIARLLHSIGSKDEKCKQSFITTHSPVALRELSGNQIFIVRSSPERHSVTQAGISDDIQSTLRAYPEAFLAKSIIIGEGASEVGLIRGLDHFRTTQGKISISANGVTFIDGGGSDKFLKRAITFQQLGYNTAILCDNDVQLDKTSCDKYTSLGGTWYYWDTGLCLEQQIINDFDDNSILALLKLAVDINGEEYINSNLLTLSAGTHNLTTLQILPIDPSKKNLIAQSAKTRNGWFKSVSKMEKLSAEIIGPQFYLYPQKKLNTVLTLLFEWALNAK